MKRTTVAKRSQQLELTWYNKDRALIPTADGRYGYTWVHPTDPRYCETRRFIIDDEYLGQQAPKHSRKHYSERADYPPQTDNLLITGDSGDVLEALTRVPELRAKYAGEIKCIYIDPPFNTGELTFGNYDDNLEHSIWLTMVRDRLQHMHSLLKNDGVIWVHLDDHENHRMRVLLDETFGPGNFMAEVVWQKADSPRRGDGFSVDQDTIVVYRKSDAFEPKKTKRTAEDNARFANPDDDPLGPWADGDPSGNHGDGHGGMCYAIQNPITGEMMRPPRGANWRYSQRRIFAALNMWAPYRYENLHDADWRADNEGVAREKASDDVCAIVLDATIEEARQSVETARSMKPLPEILIRSTGGLGRKGYIPPEGNNARTWWTNDEVGHNRTAKSEIKKLFPGKSPFATPKPERLLERIIEISTNPGDMVLDVFAGAGTTAAVAQKTGRRWITCELLDKTVDTYTLPRLRKVISGEDDGGITTTEGTHILADGVTLPNKMTIAEAVKLTRLLNKATKDNERWEDDETLAELKAMVKTKKTPTLINWRGGGGFRTAHLSPACFDYDPQLGITTLTKDADDDIDTLIGAIAGHRGFRLTPGEYFHGISGRNRLLVTRTPVDEDFVAEVASHLAEGELMTIASTVVLDGARAAARKTRRGSRILHIPHDLFTVTEDDKT